jgi:hypothetical protein
VGKKAGDKAGAAEGVEVTLNPEELDLDTAAMQAKYDETMREQQSQLEKEDLSDMVAAHAAKQRVHCVLVLYAFECACMGVGVVCGSPCRGYVVLLFFLCGLLCGHDTFFFYVSRLFPLKCRKVSCISCPLKSQNQYSLQ